MLNLKKKTTNYIVGKSCKTEAEFTFELSKKNACELHMQELTSISTQKN